MAFIKRFVDLILTVPAFVLLSPVLIITALLVRCKLGKPVLFSQERPGLNGRPFKIFKFRTMTDARTPDGHLLPDEKRLTRFGRFLRSTSLDELPELWNVLKGEMSWVGPRPELPHIAANYKSWQWQRVSVPPGITGWWQVSGRSDLPLHLNTHFDLYYIRNYSIFFDLRIILMTVREVLSGRGAY